MSVERVKKSKPFYLKDIAVYSAVAIIVLILFMAFVIIPRINASTNGTAGFSVEVDGKTVVTHDYTSHDFVIDKDFLDLVEIEDCTEGYLVTIYLSQEKDGFNQLLVNKTEKTVKMLDSDCRSKQCTYLHEVSDNGIIYCAPRKLKITPTSGSGFIPPVTG